MARKPLPLTAHLRQLILSCGLSRYALAKETGVSEAALSMFVTGKRGLSNRAMDRIGQFLNLTITRKKG